MHYFFFQKKFSVFLFVYVYVKYSTYLQTLNWSGAAPLTYNLYEKSEKICIYLYLQVLIDL